MKISIYLVTVVVALLFASVLPVQAAQGQGQGSGYGQGYGHGQGYGYGQGYGHGQGYGYYGHGYGYGHSSFNGNVWIGPGWGWGGWGPWWWGAAAYPYYGAPAYPYYYGTPPVVNQEQSPAYVQPAPQAEEQSYWYFCPDSRNYYPYVKQCPNGWMKVVAPPAPPDYRE